MPNAGGLRDQPASWVYWASFYKSELAKADSEANRVGPGAGGTSVKDTTIFGPDGESLI